jgi:hypothetical protein
MGAADNRAHGSQGFSMDELKAKAFDGKCAETYVACIPWRKPRFAASNVAKRVKTERQSFLTLGTQAGRC